MYKSSHSVKSAILFLLAFSIVELSAQSIKWNVLWFMCDQHSPHFASIDSQSPQNVYTPNLDRLAKEAIMFNKAYVAYPLCSPTRASILTGEVPQKHGKLRNSGYLVSAGPTGPTPSIGHIFRDAGYNTALLGKTHTNMLYFDMSPSNLFEGKNIFIGFDYRLDESSDGVYPGTSPFAPSQQIYEQKTASYLKAYPQADLGAGNPSWEKAIFDAAPDPKSFGGGTTGNTIADKHDGMSFYDALEYLEAYVKGTSKTGQNRGDFKIGKPANPFFLYVSIKKPHEPWQAPNMHDSIDFYAMYSGRPADDNLTYRHKSEMKKKRVLNGLTADHLAYDMGSFKDYGNSYYPDLSPELVRLSRARYASAVSWVDHMLGCTMDQLEQLNDPNNPGKKLSQTTILVYTSDHGDMMGEKNRMSKSIMHEGSARVPFLIRMPGILPANVRSDILVNHVDMLPTIAGLCGLGANLRKGIEGKDLSAAIKVNNPALGRERSFSQVDIVQGDNTKHPLYVMGRSQQYKFIRSSQKAADGKPLMVLFDMDNDPLETKNLAADPKYAAVVNRESAAMDTFLMEFGVPPVNLQLKVSTITSSRTPLSSGDLNVAVSKGRVSFVPGKNLQGRSGALELCIYSQNGALLKRITFTGLHENGYVWNLRNDAGKSIQSSLYLYRYTFLDNQGRRISRAGKLVWAGF